MQTYDAVVIGAGMGGLAAGKDYSNMAVRLWYRELLKLIMGDEFAGGTLENQTELLREFSGKVYGRLGRILYRKDDPYVRKRTESLQKPETAGL